MEINLQKISGLPILFDNKRMGLKFNGDFPFMKKSERSLEEMQPYLKNPEARIRLPAGRQGPDPVYKVWRCAHLRKDDEKIKAANLRYDITLIPPGTIGGEFAKTAGHYHKNEASFGFSYPEILEVLLGRAYFLIQTPGDDPKNLKSVKLVEAGPGDKFIVPPDFSGHNTINVFDQPLLFVNWISDKTVYDYKIYKNYHGGAYYFMNNDSLIDIIPNPNYGPVPEIKKIRAGEYPELGILKNKPIYSLIDNLDKLRFLNHPEEFAALGW